MPAGAIRVGIGGWDYDPWRESFYPPGLPKSKQLEYAAARLGAIEINATYYKLQKPELFARWRDAVPEGFRFAVKGSRFCTNRKVLAEGSEAVARFCGQGLAELGDRLGPILWQFMATKRFDPDDFGAFLKLLPGEAGGVPLSHVVEPRHESFRCAEFLDMARAAGVAVAIADSDDYPSIGAPGGGLVYARLQRSPYDEAALDGWAAKAAAWAEQGETYLFFIAGAKETNPAAATALMEKLERR
ncbi:MAG: DUF72 domain-containing protein [Allosphingosinicella sp.]|uniref:DUF72 domain-containing protein n=1 Tax=Allosphingosinicella sp. TaxID=2823234 RepID=UPI00393C6B4C